MELNVVVLAVVALAALAIATFLAWKNAENETTIRELNALIRSLRVYTEPHPATPLPVVQPVDDPPTAEPTLLETEDEDNEEETVLAQEEDDDDDDDESVEGSVHDDITDDTKTTSFAASATEHAPSFLSMRNPLTEPEPKCPPKTVTKTTERDPRWPEPDRNPKPASEISKLVSPDSALGTAHLRKRPRRSERNQSVLSEDGSEQA
jgi:hypothetical protein